MKNMKDEKYIKRECPDCRAALDIPDIYEGREVICPKCKTHFAVMKNIPNEKKTVDLGPQAGMGILRFEIQGKGENTGRKRKRVYFALNEVQARQLAENDGTSIDKIVKLPPEPPTDRQLEYAKILGLSIPLNATKKDLTDLISLKVERDRPSTKRHRAFAKKYGIHTTDFIGKKSLFDRIQEALRVPGREKELLAWFTFRVYRSLVNGASNAPVEHPDDPIIEEIVKQLVTDKKTVASVRRYEGRELIWFGEWTSPDGCIHAGASNHTIAYKQISLMLKERVGIPIKSPQKPYSSGLKRNLNKRVASDPKGCLSVIVVAFIILVCIMNIHSIN